MASENRSTSDALAPDVNNQIDEKLIAEDTEISTDNAGIASKNITDTITDGITELEQLLKDKPYQFGFLQTLRCFESLHNDKPRIGKSCHHWPFHHLLCHLIKWLMTMNWQHLRLIFLVCLALMGHYHFI